MSARKLAVVIVGAGLAIGVAACDTSTATGATPATTPPATATTSPATEPAKANPSTTAPSKSGPAKSGPAKSGAACPATGTQLRKAIKKTVDNGVSATSELTKIVCHDGYAIATVPENTRSDEQYVVFRYAGGAWTFHSSGSADICGGVPADVVKRFRDARYGACR